MFLDSILSRLHRSPKALPPHAAYELWATSYDRRENNAILAAEERALLPLLDRIDLEAKEIIDFGCGTGRYAEHCLSRKARSVTGVDFSRQMLLHARNKSHGKGLYLVEARVADLPISDSKFDLGIATLVLSHLPSIAPAVGEMSRVLRPGATLLVSDWHPDNDKRGWKRIFDVDDGGQNNRRFIATSYNHSKDEYHREFIDHGFTVRAVVEPIIDGSLEAIFRRTNMMHVYEENFGQPILIVYELHKR